MAKEKVLEGFTPTQCVDPNAMQLSGFGRKVAMKETGLLLKEK